MLRMILADDEPVIMRGIRKLVDWAQLGISIVGEYGNGSSAMEGVLTEKPPLPVMQAPEGEEEKGGQPVLLEETTYLPVLAEILFDGTENEQEKKLIRFSVSSFLETYLAEKELGIVFSRDTHIVAVLKGISFGGAKEILLGLCREECKSAGRKTAFVVGRPVGNMGQIPEEYEKCLEMSRYFFFEDYLELLVLSAGEGVFSQQRQEDGMAAARERMLGAIIAQNRKDFERAFEDFAGELCFTADGRKEDACYYFCSTVRIVEEKMRELNLEGKNPDIKQLLEQGRLCPDFSRMKAYFKDCLEGYLALLRQAMENNDRKDIVRAKEYIEQHFRENLTLEVLAGVMYMNPYYFSSFFKKNAGENFKDYVNRVRIRHAVPLLVGTDMKTYEIAEETGFRDVRSFTEAFSRAYGETPAGYRKRVLDGKKAEP